jgi:hypothetical protein
MVGMQVHAKTKNLAYQEKKKPQPNGATAHQRDLDQSFNRLINRLLRYVEQTVALFFALLCHKEPPFPGNKKENKKGNPDKLYPLH